MIAFLIAAFFADPTPMISNAGFAPQPLAEPVRDEAAILSGVVVTLECTARASGQVDGCQVLGETHPGLGFGDAAIALMRDVRVAPGARDVQFARTIQFTP